jgi:hypothetical protein
MKKLVYSIFVFALPIFLLSSCVKEPEGLVDCASHRDSVAAIRQASDNSASFFGAWIASQSCDTPPESQNYQISIEADMDNYPTGVLVNNLEPEFSGALSGFVSSDSVFIPESSYINTEGDTLVLSAQGIIAGDSLSFSFTLQKIGVSLRSCNVQASRIQ